MSREQKREIGNEHLPVISGSEVNSRIFRAIDNSLLQDKNLLIVCEDNTRATPVHTFFPELIDRFHSLNTRISVLFALGTHRPMRRDEMLAKLGISDDQAQTISLLNHNSSDESQLVRIGEIEGKTLKINRTVEDADTILTISSILPHRVVGFSGGAKMLCPGVGNKEFIDYSHWKSNQYPEELIMGNIDNPMRALIDKQGEMIQQRFPEKNFICVSAVTTAKGIVDVFIGSFKDSYMQAAELSKDIFIKEIEPSESILAIVDDKCTDFWQAAKAVYNCARALKDGGTIVVRGRLEEGISAINKDDILEYGYSDPETIQELYRSGKITNQLAASHMIRVSEHLQRVNVVLCSENIPEETCKKANLGYLDPKKLDPSMFGTVVHHAVDIVLQKEKDKLVLTGSTGNVGSKLLEILSQNYKLFELDVNFNEREPTSRRGFKCNIADSEQLKNIFDQLGNVKYIVHLAGDPSVNATWESALQNNIIGTHNIYEQARMHQVERIIFASSNHVTGGYEGIPPNLHKKESPQIITPGDPIQPNSDYGTSKVFGEAVARQYFEQYGIESICLRIGTVVPNDSPTYDERVRKTWLSKRDLEQLVLKALNAPVKFGIYYGVSNNEGKFWDITNAQEDLGYMPIDDASLT
jgi:lactate racemase